MGINWIASAWEPAVKHIAVGVYGPDNDYRIGPLCRLARSRRPPRWKYIEHLQMQELPPCRSCSARVADMAKVLKIGPPV